MLGKRQNYLSLLCVKSYLHQRKLSWECGGYLLWRYIRQLVILKRYFPRFCGVYGICHL